MIEEDYLDLPELERRKKAARKMQYAIAVLPAVILTVVQALIRDEISWLLIVALLLSLYGGISCYLLGRSWTRRWDALIREKADATD